MSSKPEAAVPAQVPISLTHSLMPPHDGDYSDSDNDAEDDLGNRGAAMMFDRSLVGDRNGLKTSILRSVYDNQIHLQARKGEAFDHLAAALQKQPEFKCYHLHGRKLQKSFNKIARDIKDCIVAGNEPSRWGKEEPEFFTIARKIFEEARRAGIRAFDEKLKSKSMEDRIIDADRSEDGKRKRKRDFNTVMAESGTINMLGMDPSKKLEILAPHHFAAPGAHAAASAAAAASSANAASANGGGTLNASVLAASPTEWMKALDDYFHIKLQEIREQHLQAVGGRLTKAELEAALSKAVEQLAAIGAKTIGELLTLAGISEQAKTKIFECGFHANDNVLVFLLTYSDAIAKNAHPITSLREQFDNITARDASVLYSFIGKATK